MRTFVNGYQVWAAFAHQIAHQDLEIEKRNASP
jgi:hypothetical protein